MDFFSSWFGVRCYWKDLKRYLLMFINLIFDSNVDAGMPSLASVTEDPATWDPALLLRLLVSSRGEAT
jgi:hypothetical protein